MPEPGKTDKWNSLLETLGVPASEQPPAAPQAPPEAAAPAKPQPVSSRPGRPGKATPKPKAGPPAAKSPSYWSRIAGALGLEVPAAPEPEAAPPPKAESPSSPPEPVARTREPGPRRQAPSAQTPSAQGHEAPPRQPLESMFGPKQADVDVFGLDRDAERG